MNCCEAKCITIESVLPQNAVIPSDKDGQIVLRIKVAYNDTEQKGLPKELIISDSVYPLNKIIVGGHYKAICDRKGNILFLSDIAVYHHREAFISEYYPMITKTIHTLQFALQFCGADNDRDLVRETITDLFYTLIMLGRESELPFDDEFFMELPF